MSSELRFRQIHLDFHTPDTIAGIGYEFDSEKFVHTLQEAAVDSITCFSRCHHGYIYHDTRLPHRHPHLTCNLLAEQIRACHKADIKVPIYITVGWDHLMSGLHPEWCEIDEKGQLSGRGPLGVWGWTKLDFASPYIDYVIEQTQEVCDIFGDEVDGLFFDIIFQHGVHSRWCMERFKQFGWDPTDRARQKQLRELLVNECTDRLFDAVRERNKNCPIFFNSGHVGPSIKPRLKNYSHLELESLPTGGWGYMHFPITCRYARTLDHDFLAMTGRFSETWGHFNSYKNEAALEYECLLALALGSKCSVGDQLHPRGTLEQATYNLVGPVYRKVRDLEPWCKGAKGVAEIGVYSAESFDESGERLPPPNLGIARMLIEGRHQFDFVDSDTDWSGYKVIVLPDVIKMPPKGIEKLNQFVAQGGSVIASHQSLKTLEGDLLSVFKSAVNSVEGDLPYCPDFLRPKTVLPAQADTDFVMYERGLHLLPAEGAESLAEISNPFFTRTWDKFISHSHSPVDKKADISGVLQKGNIILFAHPIFTTYAKHSMTFHRQLFLACLARLLSNPLVEVQGPSSLQANLTRQGDRHILHLLHYIPERRGLTLDIVEEGLPVLETSAVVRVKADRAYLVPSVTELAVKKMEGGLEVQIPTFTGFCHICLE